MVATQGISGGRQWWLAPALIALVDEADRKAPNRSRISDGSIGDSAHAARTSDHNPDASGFVCAVDITHDPYRGMDCNWVWNTLIARVHAKAENRINYLVWNRQIFNETSDGSGVWTVKPYTGSNPHTSHIHVSMRHDGGSINNTMSWFQTAKADSAGGLAAVLAWITRASKKTLKRGDTGPSVRALQLVLKKRGVYGGAIDGVFGRKTETAVKTFQSNHHLKVDGVVGPATWARLLG